jgi:carboxypeptidase D
MTELAKINTTPEPVNVDICEAVLPSVLHGRTRKENGTEYCTNIYDVRLEDTVPACGMNWPPDLAGVTPYLDRPDVQRALHAGAAPTAWTECRGRVHAELQNKHSASAITLLPSVLERAQVLLFAGDQDFICNYVGVENVIRALEWNGGTGLGVRPLPLCSSPPS